MLLNIFTKETYKVRRKTINLGEWISFVLMPILVFPAYWFIATLFDWGLGDSSVILQIEYASKGQLLHDYLADWFASLPFGFIVSWLIVLPIYCFCKRRAYKRITTYLLVGVAVWLGVGVWLYKLDSIGLMIMVMTGSMIGVGLYLLSLLSERNRRLS